MEHKTVYDLSDICESVFTGRPLTEATDDEDKKKDKEDSPNENPFADTSDDDTEKETDDKESPFGEDTDDGDADTDTDTDTDTGTDTETDDANDSDTDDATDTAFGGEDAGEDDPELGGGSTEYDELGQLGIEIIMLSSQAHFWHINCRKGSQHAALDELYHKMQIDGDRLLESVISKTNQSIVASGELSFDFGDLEFNSEESIGILEDVRDHVNEVASSFADDQTFANVLGDISEDLSTAIYKLTRFDSGSEDING